MPNSALLMGAANGTTEAPIWRFNEGADDAGQPFDMVAESVWTPANAGQLDFVFYAVYVTITWTMSAVLEVSAQIDADPTTEAVAGWDFAPLGPQLTLVGGATRQTQTFEFPMMTTMSRGGSEVSRNAMRGRRARIRIATVGGVGAGVLSIDGVGLDLEPLGESLAQEGP